jgi:hypothetical protein
MSAVLLPVLVQVGTTTTPLPTTNAAQASISCVVTDSSGSAQTAVVLTGTETPPWSFSTSVNAGAGTVVCTALDTAGATIGTPFTGSFTITPAAIFQAPSSVTVTPATTVAAAAIHAAAAKRA